jgi:hypothetical protein
MRNCFAAFRRRGTCFKRHKYERYDKNTMGHVHGKSLDWLYEGFTGLCLVLCRRA